MSDQEQLPSDDVENQLLYHEHNLTVTEEMQPGDMIEFKRGWYTHWGVCIGKGFLLISYTLNT